MVPAAVPESVPRRHEAGGGRPEELVADLCGQCRQPDRQPTADPLRQLGRHLRLLDRPQLTLHPPHRLVRGQRLRPHPAQQ